MDRRVLGWGALTLGGFALGLLALASPRGESGAEGAAVVLTPSVPGGLLNAILALTALAVVLFLALLVPRGIRQRRKKGDDEFELSYEPPKVSAWAWLILAMLALVPVGMLAAALWLDGSGTLVFTLLGLVATPAYFYAEPPTRPDVVRLAVAVAVGVALLHLLRSARTWIAAQPPSVFESALVPRRAEAWRAPLDVTLRQEVRFSVAHQGYFEHVLWPRLLRLAARSRGGSNGGPTRPAGRWLGWGPSLDTLRRLVRDIEDHP